MAVSALLFWMLVGHVLADYPLQGDFLAKAKNRTAPVPSVPWPIALWAHALIHGGMVAAVTGSITLGVAETLVHVWIDDTKCRGVIDFAQDQLAHVVCKVAWALVADRSTLDLFA